MVQIIGYLLCVYLVVKACEIFQRNALVENPSASANFWSAVGGILAIAGAVAFFFWLSAQSLNLPTWVR